MAVGREVSESRDRAVLALDSPRAWESWLTKHHATSSEVWLKIVKKSSKMKGPSYEEGPRPVKWCTNDRRHPCD
jgi:uncharacterized protein YdeI (YjbR/CyaY-like superfamily)